MTWPRRIDSAALAAWPALLVGLVLLLGPGATAADAAECPGAGAPGYQLGEREGRDATLCLLNRERSSRGLGPLRIDAKQQRAAEAHNKLMIRKRCFSHQCQGERDLIGRSEAAGYLPCGCSWSIAENIAWGGRSTSSPRRIVAAWMSSASHRTNILNRRFEHAGVAVNDGSPEGGGDSATYTLDLGFKD